MKLAPQAAAVLQHLKIAGSVTGVEAAAILKVRHLPARIFDLRQAGIVISRTTHHDSQNQRYVRYGLGA